MARKVTADEPPGIGRDDLSRVDKVERKCSACGADPGEGSFCQHCGTPLTPEATGPPTAAGAPPPQPAPQQSPPAQAPPQQPPAPQPRRRSFFSGGCLIAGLIVIAVLGVGGFFAWQFISEEVLPEIQETTDVFTAFNEAPPGPCFEVQASGGVLSDWTEVSCDGPRQIEVTFAAPYEEGPYPGDNYLVDNADSTCREAFETYVGISAEQSIFDYDWLIPDEDLWANGVRSGICLVVSDDGSPITETVKGSER